MLPFDDFSRLIELVVAKIEAEGFAPDTILGLSTGGFPTAAVLAKRLGIRSRNVIGLPVYKDDTGDYHLDELAQLGDCTGRRVLVVDDASKRGLLTRKAVAVVRERGGMAKSCVLIASNGGLLPDFVGETCDGNPPHFFWEKL